MQIWSVIICSQTVCCLHPSTVHKQVWGQLQSSSFRNSVPCQRWLFDILLHSNSIFRSHDWFKGGGCVPIGITLEVVRCSTPNHRIGGVTEPGVLIWLIVSCCCIMSKAVSFVWVFFFFYAFQHCNLEAINDCAAFSVSYLAGDKMVKKKEVSQISLKMTQ